MSDLSKRTLAWGKKHHQQIVHFIHQLKKYWSLHVITYHRWHKLLNTENRIEQTYHGNCPQGKLSDAVKFQAESLKSPHTLSI